MTGEVDAFDLKPGAPRDLHVEERQRDRNAGPAVEHLVEKAVARILVRGFVAGETELAEQIVVQRQDAGVAIGIDVRRREPRRRHRVAHARARLVAIAIEPIQVRTGVKRGIFDAGNHQRRDRQVGIGAERGVTEAPDELRFHGAETSLAKKGRGLVSPPARDFV